MITNFMNPLAEYLVTFPSKNVTIIAQNDGMVTIIVKDDPLHIAITPNNGDFIVCVLRNDVQLLFFTTSNFGLIVGILKYLKEFNQ